MPKFVAAHQSPDVSTLCFRPVEDPQLHRSTPTRFPFRFSPAVPLDVSFLPNVINFRPVHETDEATISYEMLVQKHRVGRAESRGRRKYGKKNGGKQAEIKIGEVLTFHHAAFPCSGVL